MTDSLKFGPEWLRNLSQDGPTSGTGGGGPRYQLAEHRYGREEMLALFDKSLGQPEILGRFKSLFVERLQLPLALAPTQEEENRGGWLPRPMTGMSGVRGTGRGGVSVDRGRGRGGRGSYHSQGVSASSPYQRSQSSFEPEEGGLRISTRPARPWSEQNGETEWNGSTSPRKEYNPTGRANTDNWRRHRGTDDDDGWRNQPEQRRPEKWTRGGGSSWRDGETDGSGDRDLSRGFERLERELRGANERGDRPPPPAVTRSWNARKPWDVDDILPEWAMENPSESGGTFDASGAFHGSDDEQERGGGKLNHSHSTNNMQSPRPAPLSRSQTQGSIAVNKHNTSNSTDPGKNRLKENTTTELSHSEEELYQNRKDEQRNSKPASTRNNKQDREISIEHLDQNSHQKSSQNNTKQIEIQKPISSRTQSPPKSQQSTPKKSVKENDPVSKSANERGNTPKILKPDVEKSYLESMLVNKISNEDLTKQIHKYVKQYAGALSQKEEVVKKPETPKQSEDEFARMQEVADDIVAQLMMDEERSPVVPLDQYKVVQPQPVLPAMVSPSTVHNVMPVISQSVSGSDKWFYRDPQGEVQGPFLANEMGEWYRAGYFTNELMVRRACDERYTTLGELVKICGGVVPFSPSARLPPLKADPAISNTLPVVQPGLIPGSAQYRQAQLLSRQIAARQEAQAQVLRELSRSERWSTMTPGEQNAVLMQHLAQIPFPDAFPPASVPAGLAIPPIVPMTQPTPAHNPLLQLISQMQQAKQQSSNIMSQVPTIDPHKQQSAGPHLNHISGMAGHPNIPMPGNMNHTTTLPNHINTNMHNPAVGHNQVLNPTVPINSQTDQLNQNANNMESMQKSDDLMSMFKQFFTKMGNNKPAETGGSWNPSWNANTNSIGSMWDMQIPKPEMKTEQQILEEQMRLRKETEEQDKREKEHKRQLEEKSKQQEQAKKQAEMEEKLKAQKEAEERQKEEIKRKEQDKKKAEEKEKRESERIKKELEKAKREAEEKRMRELEEKRRMKEERKREEELRRDADKRKAEEALRAREQDDEAKKLAQEEEVKRKAIEAKKVQEQQRQVPKVAPWRPPVDLAINTTSSLSLAEIQRLEKEKRAEQLKEQAQQQALRQQQAALLKEQELAEAKERSAIQLKWANQKPQVSNKVKSLAEIQAEEMAKQAAADRLAAQQRECESPVVQQTNSIWSSAPSLNWTSTAWTSNTGFWDETPTPTPSPAVTQNKVQTKSPKAPPPFVNNSANQNKSIASNKSSNNQNTATHNGGQKTNALPAKQDKNTTAANNNNNLSKKKKKDEKDDFTNWCTKAMSSINSSVDVPTFIGFLNDIDSPYEVKDYIRTYLGDSKDAVEFAKQFLEKRSRFRNQQRLATAHIDDMCSPAPAINPGSEFHEQGKGKKTKKNKMQKIDNRILGFNVTAAQDRINIGDRDYGDAN